MKKKSGDLNLDVPLILERLSKAISEHGFDFTFDFSISPDNSYLFEVIRITKKKKKIVDVFERGLDGLFNMEYEKNIRGTDILSKYK